MRPSILFALGLAAVCSSSSQPQANTPAITASGAFFGLSVADLSASSTWYQEKLGLTVTMQVPKTNGTAVVVLEGGGLTVELIQVDGAKPLSQWAPTAQPTTVHGFFKAGVVVDNYSTALATLQARGVQIVAGPFPAQNGQRANVIIRDNAGNLIQLFQKS